MTNLFVTATDTDAGKTLVACALTTALTKLDYKVATFKPLSAGCDLIDGQLVNNDALQLQQRANCQQSLQQVNPFAFKEPIAPHIAAKHCNKQITVSDIRQAFNQHCNKAYQYSITEGAGGWRLPLGNHQFLSEFVQQENMLVVLVVNMKLGCLNHATLTYESIINDGLTVVGWVANSPDQMPYLQENISELTSIINAPLLGIIGHVANSDEAISALSLTPLLDQVGVSTYK